LIYHAADHRNPADIQATWTNLLEQEHRLVEEAEGQSGAQQPYEVVSRRITELADKLSLSESTFPPHVLVPMVEAYAFEYQRGVGPPSWVIDLFLSVGIPHGTLFAILEGMFYNDEAPFQGRNRSIIAGEMFTVIKEWYAHCRRMNQVIFGSLEKAQEITDALVMLMQNGLNQADREGAEILRAKIAREINWQ
jgi:nuclear pore complex protein Nup155